MITRISFLLLTATLLLAACAAEGDASADTASPRADAGADAATAATTAAADPRQPTSATAQSPDASGALDVADAWIRSAPPGATALAGYATLRNPGAAPVTVRACDSEGFAATELHQTLHEDGMARMRRMEELVVPAEGQAMLAPGGAHLMLIQPAQLPAEGARVDVCLSVNGEPRQLSFEVRPSGTTTAHDHEHSGAHEH